MKRVAEGDQSAFTLLYETTSKTVFGLIYKVIQDRETAEEVLLDVYTQAWRQAKNYDSQRGTPLAWLMTIGRSRAIDRLRSGKHEKANKDPLETAGQLSAPTSSPEEVSTASETQRFVRAALDTLTPEQREVIELAYFLGLSHTEIALKLSQPLGTVKTRIRLGMVKLRELLSPVLSS
ncbi:MAG: sigma-70 family RNA polymerase sigma factor [Acidobacteriota bacterium]